MRKPKNAEAKKRNAEHQRKFQAARKSQGYVRFETYIKPEWKDWLKGLIKKREESEKTTQNPS